MRKPPIPRCSLLVFASTLAVLLPFGGERGARHRRRLDRRRVNDRERADPHRQGALDGPISFSYRWLRCDSSGGSCAAISGAAGSTYTLGDADVGRRLRVVVTATNSAGSSEATSSATGSIRPGAAPPSNTSLPSISGSARDGSLLTASHGNRSNNPSSYAYQWLRCDSAGASCNPIGGANSRQYTVTEPGISPRGGASGTGITSPRPVALGATRSNVERCVTNGTEAAFLI